MERWRDGGGMDGLIVDFFAGGSRILPEVKLSG